jgi:hypothetical protein
MPTVELAMGRKGDLLALVDGAPGGLRTLQAALTTWSHRVLVAEVHRRSDLPAAEAGDGVGNGGRGVGEGGPGEPPVPEPPVPEPPAAVEAPDATETLATAYVVVSLPDRWRVVGRGHLAVSDGRRSWAGTSTLVTEREATRSAIFDAGAISACLYPGTLLRRLDFGEPDVRDIEGRPVWYVEGGPRRPAPGAAPPKARSVDLRLQRELVGIDHRIWFDADTGVVLRHEGFVDGEPCSTTSLTDLVFGQPVSDSEFRPPPGAVVRSRHELLRDHLAAMGIDPDTVDLDDPAQVREALRQGG